MKVEPTISKMASLNGLIFGNHDGKNQPVKGILKNQSMDESVTTKHSGSTPRTVPVTFDNIEVREYSVVLGDNPSCTSGPPISIGWSYNEGIVIGVDEYESLRQNRRNFLEMAMPRTVREDILMYEFGFSRSQLAAAVRENVKAKNQRRQTLNNLGSYSKIEEAFESFRRKLRRGICRKRSSIETLIKDQRWIDQSRRSAQFVAEETAASRHESLVGSNVRDSLSEIQQEVSDHRMHRDSVDTPMPRHSGHFEADKGSEPGSALRRHSGIGITESNSSVDGYLEKINGFHFESKSEPGPTSRRHSGISITESDSALDDHLEKIKGFHEHIPNMPQQLQQQDVPSMLSSQ